MNGREVASLGFKLAGLVYLVIAVPFLQGMITYLALGGLENVPGDPRVFFALQLVPFFLLVVAAVVLIARSDALPKRSFSPAQAVPVSFSVDHVQAALFSVVGVVVIALALSNLSEAGTEVVMSRLVPGVNEDVAEILFGGSSTQRTRAAGRHAAAGGIQLVLGSLLFFRSRALVRWWNSMNDAGKGEGDQSNSEG